MSEGGRFSASLESFIKVKSRSEGIPRIYREDEKKESDDSFCPTEAIYQG